MFNRKLYQETFAHVQASGETLSEVLNMTKYNRNHTGVRITRMLLIAAVLSAMLATTAFAYVGFTQYENPIQMLKTFFGADEYYVDEGRTHIVTYYDQTYEFVEPTVEHVPLDEEVAAEIAPFVSAVGKSTGYGDFTLTVEAHHYDSVTDCGIIYYTLENPNGITGYELQYDGEVWWPGGEKVSIKSCHGRNYIIEEETTETKLSVAHYYSGIYGDTGYIVIEPSLWLAFKQGEATFEDAQAFEDAIQPLYLPLNDGGGMRGVTLADGDIGLSAIGIRINVERMDFLMMNDVDGTPIGRHVDEIEKLKIRYKDGSEYVVMIGDGENVTMNYAYCIGSGDGEEISFSFNRLIDLDDVEAVIINDTEFTDIQEVTGGLKRQKEETTLPVATEPANP